MPCKPSGAIALILLVVGALTLTVGLIPIGVFATGFAAYEGLRLALYEHRLAMRDMLAAQQAPKSTETTELAPAEVPSAKP